MRPRGRADGLCRLGATCLRRCRPPLPAWPPPRCRLRRRASCRGPDQQFSITSIITPLLYTGIFAWFTAADAPVTFGGAPYVLAGIFLALALLALLLKVERPAKKTAAAPQA